MWLPSKPDVTAITGHQRGRSGGRGAMTLQASGIDVDGPRKIKRSPRRGVPLTGDLTGIRIIAKMLDQIRLPVGSPVSEVGWIERCLLVGVLRMLLPQLQEILRRGVERHALGREIRLHPDLQQGKNL